MHRRRLEEVGERVAVARRRGLAVLSVLAGVGTIYVLAGGSSIEWGHLGRHNPGELLFLGTAVSAPVLAALLTPARRR